MKFEWQIMQDHILPLVNGSPWHVLTSGHLAPKTCRRLMLFQQQVTTTHKRVHYCDSPTVRATFWTRGHSEAIGFIVVLLLDTRGLGTQVITP